MELHEKFNIKKQCYFHKMFRLEQDYIKNFIFELEDNELYVITPLISVNCRLNDPYLNLSRQFLVNNQSNHKLIHNFLYIQIDTFKNDFYIDDINDNHYPF